MTDPTKPSVLFVCVKNGGKSQMAAGLLRKIAGDTVSVDSAGTKPGSAINGLSAEVLLEAGVDITDQSPKQLTEFEANLAEKSRERNEKNLRALADGEWHEKRAKDIEKQLKRWTL